MFAWLDAHPWLATAIFFAAGSLVGVVLRVARRGKYDGAEPAA